MTNRIDYLQENKELINESLNFLLDVFKKAADLQQHCGDIKSENVYEAAGHREEYQEYFKTLDGILHTLDGTEYSLEKLFNIALNPKLSPDGSPQFPIHRRQKNLPEKTKDWEKILQDILLDYK